MKNFLLFSILLFFCTPEIVFPQNTENKEPVKQTKAQIKAARKARTAAAVSECIKNKDITVTVDRIYPLKGIAKNSTDGYTISLSNDTLNCYLPYFGEMKSAVMAGNLAISSEKQQVQVSEQYDQKSESYILQFHFYNKEFKDIWKCIMQIFTDGKAAIRMESNARDSIGYSGELKLPQENQ